jgi:hypothetical protein
LIARDPTKDAKLSPTLSKRQKTTASHKKQKGEKEEQGTEEAQKAQAGEETKEGPCQEANHCSVSRFHFR